MLTLICPENGFLL